jgi:hypothetical protein
LAIWGYFVYGYFVYDPMDTLSKLKQNGSLDNYKTQFEILANRVQKLIDPHEISYFLGGLMKDNFQLPIRMLLNTCILYIFHVKF